MWLAVAVLCCTNFIIGGSNLTLTAYVLLFRVNELLLLLVLWLARATGHACYYISCFLLCAIEIERVVKFEAL